MIIKSFFRTNNRANTEKEEQVDKLEKDCDGLQ